MPQAYRVLKNSAIGGAHVGDIVYEQSGYDYGLAADDTRAFGINTCRYLMMGAGGWECGKYQQLADMLG